MFQIKVNQTIHIAEMCFIQQSILEQGTLAIVLFYLLITKYANIQTHIQRLLKYMYLSQKVQLRHLPVFFTFISSKEDDMSYSPKHYVHQGPSFSPSRPSTPVLEAILLQWYLQRRNKDARILFSVLGCSTRSNRRVEITVEA